MKLGKYKQAVAYIALAVALVVGSSIFDKAYYDKHTRETTEKILESQRIFVPSLTSLTHIDTRTGKIDCDAAIPKIP